MEPSGRKRMQVATFYTQLGALEFWEALRTLGDESARMLPAPRKLSVSCGTAVRFSRSFRPEELNNPDLEAVYQEEPGDGFSLIWEQEAEG